MVIEPPPPLFLMVWLINCSPPAPLLLKLLPFLVLIELLFMPDYLFIGGGLLYIVVDATPPIMLS
jgi:hypothetical protein